MNTTKTLMLAAVAAALSIGASTAMAQSQVPSSSEGDYFLQRHHAAPRVILNGWAGPVQAGSSDVGTERTGSGHVLPFKGDYGDLANPG